MFVDCQLNGALFPPLRAQDEKTESEGAALLSATLTDVIAARAPRNRVAPRASVAGAVDIVRVRVGRDRQHGVAPCGGRRVRDGHPVLVLTLCQGYLRTVLTRGAVII